MGKVGYDPFEGWARLFGAAEQLDSNAAMVMTLHAALEREMDVLLSKQLRFPERLKGLGFGHKINVIAATWHGEPEAAEFLRTALYQFNELRNVIAHSDDAQQLKGTMEALRRAHANIGARQDEVDELLNIACDICAFMGDGAPTLKDFHDTAAALGKLVNSFAEAMKETVERVSPVKASNES